MSDLPQLTVADRESATWQKLRAYLIDRIDTSRKQNDGRMSEMDREHHNGRLAEMKHLLSLEDEPITMPKVGL